LAVSVYPCRRLTGRHSCSLDSVQPSSKAQLSCMRSVGAGTWLSVSVQVTPCVGTKVAGVDPGLMNLAVVNCEGETLFFSGDRAAFVRRMGKAKALGAIRRMKNKEARWMKNQDHEISRKIVDWCIACGHVEHADSVGAANSAGAISGLAAA